MDLRVYVDGVARIICDLTRKTTVHDIIIALAQYKGKAGRYSLIECAPDGTQRTLSPSELTCELIYHPDWVYILRQNPSHVQKRSKSLDEKKTSIEQQQQQTIVDTALPLNSPTGYFRTVTNTNNTENSTILSSRLRKHANFQKVFPSTNKNINNNNNNNIHSNDSLPSPPIQKRSSRTPLQKSFEHHSTISYGRPKSAVPTPVRETSAFHSVRNSNSQQQQYIALLQMLKAQEIQLEQQKNELNETQKEIEYYDSMIHQGQIYQDNIQHELQILEEHERRLFAECQTLAQEYSSDKLNDELEYQKELNSNYEHLQQQLTRCSSTLEQQIQMQEQIQYNIQQAHDEIEQIKRQFNNDQKEISQCSYDLDRSNSSLQQQEDLLHMLTQRTDDMERIFQQRRKRIVEVEHEVTQFDDLLLNSLAKSPYRFHSNSSNDIMKPGHIQFMNSTLLKLCPSGIWV
ncbi:unnamed protein product [Rotaria magnacalcarata]|uniref:Ras-associating domain-containing protein n=3 Tax=Rotaria magnacalcarata TaxID=392030 RepID=A0A816W0T0_9BILA|nr:unnamed protein product [Rotaria magnacalcarata]CAF1476243.1 unnamed protein product [Rotaria magnacalcarata]CAF2130311.1 unnamed protein product [Rotaria magnacalcarata]